MMDTPALDNAILRAERHAPFLRALIARRPEIVNALRADNLADVVARFSVLDDEPVARALRRARQAVALATALADLAGLASLEEVTAILSDFADRALDRAIAAAIAERTEEPPRGFAALALGKHGGRELNYSSDIDPILIFDPATLPARAREEPVEAAARIARRVVELLQTRDGDGYVLRVDLRLRPSPEITPLALPIDAALSYYETSGLPWERAAFIRARAAAGDVALGRFFLTQVRPFIWRRSLDYGAVGELRAMSHRIREHYAHGQSLGPGYDLKRGRGGIREVEFFTQIHQLIHGGRDATLRAPATLDALSALAGAGHIARGEADMLADAYRLYRTIEHRLQMIDDQQTHRLPVDPAALANVEGLGGYAPGGLIPTLAPYVAAVGTAYDALDPGGAPSLPRDGAALADHLRDAGFADPATAARRIGEWRAGHLRTMRSEAARSALEALLPSLAAALGRAPDPDAALARFDALVSGLPSAVNFFRLLQARPGLATMVADIVSHAPALASQLGRRAALLDGMIDASVLAAPPPVARLSAILADGEAGEDYQALLDRVRIAVNERRFALGVQLIEGAADPIDIAGGYARVAEAALEALTAATVAEHIARHGRMPGGELVILALGRLGGAELTHASDLDLIYLFTGDHLAESDGPKPIGATLYFNRLAQRVTAALSVPTAAGPLYEVDTRLRPSGNDGLLATSTDSFARYQAENAWTWERMALTRARPVFGSAEARDEVARMVADALAAPRDRRKLTADATEMRARIAEAKPPAGPFDVKLAPGGLVDAEFAVHVLQLGHHIGFDTDLRRAAHMLVGAGLLSPAFPEALALLTRMIVTLRLVSPESGEPPPASRAVVARACGIADWDSLLAAYQDAQAVIRGEWDRIRSPL